MGRPATVLLHGVDAVRPHDAPTGSQRSSLNIYSVPVLGVVVAAGSSVVADPLVIAGSLVVAGSLVAIGSGCTTSASGIM